jgi:hypothetical protein
MKLIRKAKCESERVALQSSNQSLTSFQTFQPIRFHTSNGLSFALGLGHDITEFVVNTGVDNLKTQQVSKQASGGVS